jgi:D-alanyl-D-alanine carboxypeptidase
VVAQRITGPLGMKETVVVMGSDLPAPVGHGYLVGMGEPLDVTRISASSTFGHGNIVSTPGDVNKLYAGLAAGKLVKPAYLPAMYATDPTNPNYGTGLWVWQDFPCGAWIGHDGSAAGYDVVGYSRPDGSRQFTVQATSINLADKVGDEGAQAAFRALIKGAACR